MENSPVLSLVMVSEGMARSIGKLPGDVILPDGLSSIKCNAIFSKYTYAGKNKVTKRVRVFHKELQKYFNRCLCNVFEKSM